MMHRHSYTLKHLYFQPDGTCSLSVNKLLDLCIQTEIAGPINVILVMKQMFIFISYPEQTSRAINDIRYQVTDITKYIGTGHPSSKTLLFC